MTKLAYFYLLSAFYSIKSFDYFYFLIIPDIFLISTCE
ncbi:hypothetical protein CHCC20335_2016 [Bacillus paralicheniformis]|nr:hypothetical protein CHCC20335_2016 [Bacillus paralicheniformis]